MDVAVDDSAGLLAQVVVLLEGVGDELVVLVAVELDFPAEEHLEEAGTGEEGVGRHDLLLEVALQLLGRVLQVQQLLAGRLLHQRLQLLLRQPPEKSVVHLPPPLRPAVYSKWLHSYNFSWYSSSSEFSGDSIKVLERTRFWIRG